MELRSNGPIALASLPVSARATAVIESDVPQLVATLVVSTEAPARIGVLFELEPGWHLYWRNPGETGVAPEIALEATGFTVGPLAWPAPETFREADDLFTTYGYEGRVLLAANLTAQAAPRADAASSRPLARAEASVLICRTQCVPATLALESPLDAAIDAGDRNTILALFKESEALVPPRADALGWELAAHWSAAPPALDEMAQLELSLDVCPRGGADCASDVRGASALTFIPFEGETFEFGREQRVSIDSGSKQTLLELS
jgi:DsbC/DsbD-like thiol-disulfide interchange protein